MKKFFNYLWRFITFILSIITLIFGAIFGVLVIWYFYLVGMSIYQTVQMSDVKLGFIVVGSILSVGLIIVVGVPTAWDRIFKRKKERKHE